MPATLFGYIWRSSARHQVVLCLLSVVVFLLSAVPLELQRRIVNDAIARGASAAILWLALAYAVVALTEGSLKLVLNVYRGWVSESTVRDLRHRIGLLTPGAVMAEDRALAEGVEISMILSEAEPIGGFAGISMSEPLLQRAINLRARERIRTLREVSGEIVGASSGDAELATAQEDRIGHVFRLNMGIYKIKFKMNFLMNLLHHLGVATALGVGGWLAQKEAPA